jgi:hypothetical protein
LLRVVADVLRVVERNDRLHSQSMLPSIVGSRWAPSAGMGTNAIVRAQIRSKQGTQVAAVAGVRGVPAAAGVLGGWSAIFSRKAMISSTSYHF